MLKTTKSELLSRLESSCIDISNDLGREKNTVYILDGMSLLQGIKETLFHTFEDLARRVLRCIKSLLMKGHGVKTVALVFDGYDQDSSIKQAKCQRHDDVQQATHLIKGKREVPNFRIFMKSLN